MFHLGDRFKTGQWLPTIQQAPGFLSDPEIGFQEGKQIPRTSQAKLIE
jgi:hypothetical protein